MASTVASPVTTSLVPRPIPASCEKQEGLVNIYASEVGWNGFDKVCGKLIMLCLQYPF